MIRILIQAVLGAAFGGVLLWISLRQIDFAEARSVWAEASLGSLAFAIAIYWVNIGIRTVRWHRLLQHTSRLGLGQVGEALVVGYAVNTILPARLGELFRAVFVRQRFGVAGSAALGSIVVERLLDGLVVVALFIIGLTTVNLSPGHSELVMVGVAAGTAIAVGVIALYCAVIWQDRMPLFGKAWIDRRLGVIVNAMAIVRAWSFAWCLLLTAVIWFLEAAALYFIVAALHLSLPMLALCLVAGAASLSTLFPSAPGYVGSLQIAFVLTFSALQLRPAVGVLAATAMQLFLLGPVVILGLLTLLFARLFRRPALDKA